LRPREIKIGIVALDLSIKRQPALGRAREVALAEAVGDVIAPGRRAAKCRISVILPVMPSRLSRMAAGALTMIVLNMTTA
jgi:hypothetical protein